MMSSIFLLIFSISVFAEEGIILVLEAPMLKSPHINSQVLQITRKGEKIFLHGNDLSPDYFEREFLGKEYSQEDKEEEKELLETSLGFYRTVTKSGETAYIPKKFVKPITEDERETEDSISPFKVDPTDYRLEEPLPKGYPVITDHQRRAAFSMSFGPQRQINYPYPSEINSENFKMSKGIDFSFTHPVNADPHRRLYFGVNFGIHTYDSLLNLENGVASAESKAEFSIGPFMNYEFYKRDNYSIHFGGGFYFSLLRAVITQKELSGDSEGRNFTGYNVYPHLRAMIRFPKVVADIDFFSAVETKIQVLPMRLTSSAQTESILWNQENDRLLIDSGASFNLHFGVMVAY
jgi:hypothetical protein